MRSGKSRCRLSFLSLQTSPSFSDLETLKKGRGLLKRVLISWRVVLWFWGLRGRINRLVRMSSIWVQLPGIPWNIGLLTRLVESGALLTSHFLLMKSPRIFQEPIFTHICIEVSASNHPPKWCLDHYRGLWSLQETPKVWVEAFFLWEMQDDYSERPVVMISRRLPVTLERLDPFLLLNLAERILPTTSLWNP